MIKVVVFFLFHCGQTKGTRMTLKLVVTLVEVMFAGSCYEMCALLVQVLKATHKTHTQLQKEF